jgi:hypothetical protein
MDIEKLKALALAAKTAALRPGIQEQAKDYFALVHACNPDAVLELIAEVERLRADAKRYAFIRSGGIYIEPGDDEVYVATDRGAYCKTADEFDSQIDAAIEAHNARSPSCGS